MTAEVSIACKYESFHTLIKINEPALLLKAFLSQLVPDYGGKLSVQIFERTGTKWQKITSDGANANQYSDKIRQVLEQNIDPDQSNIWFYEASQKGWYCAYKPLSTKQYAMFIHSSKVDKLIDESYIQLLFGFYCHQLSSLEGTYRDSLTGLYNRKAFDHRLATLMMKCQHFARRNNFSDPSFFVMLDIDLFKNVNDRYGHVYGDEVLTIIACLMADSFREYDLLFRYGGEEFTAVLMDLDETLCTQILHRFKDKVEAHDFPKHNQVTVSIGYTRFDKNLTVNKLIDQADRALYYCKQNGRNCLHYFETLVEQGMISKNTQIEDAPAALESSSKPVCRPGTE